MTRFDCFREDRADDVLIEEAMTAYEEDEEKSLICKIRDEIESDGEDETSKLLQAYKEASGDQAAAIDYALVCLTGWTMKSLLVKMLGKES